MVEEKGKWEASERRLYRSWLAAPTEVAAPATEEIMQPDELYGPDSVRPRTSVERRVGGRGVLLGAIGPVAAVVGMSREWSFV